MCNWCRALTPVATVSPAYRYSLQVATLRFRRSVDEDAALQLHCTPARDPCLTNWKVRSSGCAHWHIRKLARFGDLFETSEDAVFRGPCPCTQPVVKASTMRSLFRGHPTGRPAQKTETLLQHQSSSFIHVTWHRPADVPSYIPALHGGRTALHAASTAKPQVCVSMQQVAALLRAAAIGTGTTAVVGASATPHCCRP